MPSYGTGVRGREVIGFAKCTQINDKSQFNAHTYFYQVEILVPATSFEISSLGFQNLLLSMISISTERCRHTTCEAVQSDGSDVIALRLNQATTDGSAHL